MSQLESRGDDTPVPRTFGERVWGAIMIIIEWSMRLIVAAFGISVGLAATYLAQRAIGADPISMFITMGIGAGGTILIVMGHEAFHRGALFLMTLFVMAGLICSTYAMTASITGDATIKDAARAGRETRNINAELDRERRRDTADRIKALESFTFSDRTKIGATTVEMLQPTLDALRGCKCPQLALIKQKVATAKELSDLRRRREGWSAPVEASTISADPGIEVMTTVSKDLGAPIEAQSMRAGLSVWKVVAMELMAIIIPIGAFAWGRPKRKWSWFRQQDSALGQRKILEIMAAPEEVPSKRKPPVQNHDHEEAGSQDSCRNLAEDHEPDTGKISLMSKEILQDHDHDLARQETDISVAPADPEKGKIMKLDRQDSCRPTAPDRPKILVAKGGSNADLKSYLDSSVNAGMPDGKTTCKDVLGDYRRWCKANKKKALGQQAFYAAMEEMGWPTYDGEPGAAEQINMRAFKSGMWWYYGLMLKPEVKLRLVK